MTYTLLVTTFVAGALALCGAIVVRRLGAPVTARPAESPFAEAERILAQRYQRGQLTREQYERILTLLRT